MATIKQIEGRTVHQIQSGQVIVDLCSVVKELVENSIDAEATSIDVRFKNQGLDLIEVQDNGSGISAANYASVALKHHTSKLSSYSDIASLQTFGFRGEALASLCALSILTVTTCQASEVPKGSKLSFEASGKLSGSAVVAAQRGTTVSVEKLFHNLPVRRRELERNIKREWHKVVSLLNQYACIQTRLKFTVSQQPTKGKRILLFSTKGNPSTRENIINIFGAKAMTALVPLDLKLRMRPTAGSGVQSGNGARDGSDQVCIVGHVSRPAHGEGRQTPDRQMFFINGRPCGLPQFAKTFNEVYRSYNASQNPFILADIQLDTHMYDVNVSPDKRSILLHDQSDLLDTLRESLMALFDSHDYEVPASQLLKPKSVPDQSSLSRGHSQRPGPPSTGDSDADTSSETDEAPQRKGSTGRVPQGRATTISSNTRSLSKDARGQNLISRWVERESGPQTKSSHQATAAPAQIGSITSSSEMAAEADRTEHHRFTPARERRYEDDGKSLPVRDFNLRLEEASTAAIPQPPLSPSSSQSDSELEDREPPIPSVQALRPGSISEPRIRSPKRSAPEVATVVIGDETITSTVGSIQPNHTGNPSTEPLGSIPPRERSTLSGQEPSFGNGLSHLFSATPGAVSVVPTSKEGEPADDISNDTTSPPRAGAAPTTAHAAKETSLQARATSPDPYSDCSSDSSEGAGETATLPEVEETTTFSETTRGKDVADAHGRSLKGGSKRKDATLQILQYLRIDENAMLSSLKDREHSIPIRRTTESLRLEVTDLDAVDAEDKLSLTISRKDFLQMRISGQFNLGFIIATRPARPVPFQDAARGEHGQDDELFIIDQHATDEKYNFERLQATTVVQSQRLVHPKTLELTALEEEVVMQNISAIEANGFKVEIDMSGDQPVGSRCQLIALPLSRETTFDLSDLEELISLLGDQPAELKYIPRPSKVRKMFAMRACRSSIMIGKALTLGQMETLVRHMGELDKPWNCPHGRPTMRHLCKLSSWDKTGWRDDCKPATANLWRAYARGD